ncbi:peptidoglycan DD-metalloendopeptidase family protein [Flavobacterium sp. DG1-102-2]|uniref:murein hydrolase activator EnvC family protein n=1 Tax=Flavobacterium sp. DG1-102-2 TaxID=3081663 RepID=UPI0029498D6A|nr:peptidoglycan DD-metalloendopeptidase family protein [Flavobacterium sp. DG1-102-2]MDV6167694.1 peptidoglycan DD-metalloendopeptidase family protein [Flavobacterium sp. DG1-102-2]
MTRLFLTIFLICFTTFGWSQSQSAQQKKLEQRKAQLLKEMKELQNLESQTQHKEKSVLGKIEENTAKIRLSENLISTTSKQTRLLTDDIYLNQLGMNKLNRELKVLKEDYANMVVKAYKSRSEQSRIMFILSSENFLQAYKRMQYMKQYASFRKVQGEEIRSKMTKLEELDKKLNDQKHEKQQLLAESEKQKKTLEKDKDEQEVLVKTIRKDKKKYASQIKKKQQEAKDIDRKIDKMIKDAIAAANKKAAAKATTTAEKKEIAAAAKKEPNKIVLTKEEKLLANNFVANKGRLPWPVAEGYVSSKFGNHESPFEKGVVVDNKNIEITTKPGAQVRAVYDGKVTFIYIISGTKAVTVQHGDYFTLYFNLSSVNVSVGDKVTTKQSLGTVHTYPESNRTVLKFFVLQNTKYLNPEAWVSQ